MARKGKKEKLPRGMYRRDNGMLSSRIAGVDGKIIRRSLSMDLSTATTMLNEMRKQIELQRMGILPVGVERQFKTFEELRQRYKDHMLARALSHSAMQGFDQAFKQIVLQNKLVYLADMTLAKVEAWATSAAAAGLAGQSINCYVASIRSALKWAQDNGNLFKNPLANWQAVRNNEPRLRRDFLPEEIERFFAAEQDPMWRLRWLVYFHTGLRSSAGRNVCWEWIDWDARMLRLPLEHNKSRRVHEIPLSGKLYDALKLRRNELGEKAVGAVFPYITRDGVLQRLKATCRKAGIDPSGICVHSIRHTVATTVYNATGKNLKAVQEVLGHANPSTTMQYLHVTGEMKRRAIEALDFGIGASSTEGENNDPDAAECSH